MTPHDLPITARDGLRLHGRLWVGDGARATVVLSHGFGEHIGAYDHVAQALIAAGPFDVLGFDFRGHGRSPGKRGLVRSYDDLLADLGGGLDSARALEPGRPCFVLGHSNGGLVALCLAANGEPMDGLILSNPALQIAERAPRWKVAVGHILRRVAPSVTLVTPIRSESLTRDPVMMATRASDTWRHNRISAPLYFGMREAAESLATLVDRVTVPLLLFLGDDDRLIAPEPSAAFFDRVSSPDKSIRRIAGGRHELLNDLDREAILIEIATWIQGRSLARVSPV